MRALVVDDEWPARNYLVELIEGSKLASVAGAVATVEEAKQALDPSAGLGVDVAFVDVQLAESDRAGLELVRALAAERPEISFVLATAIDRHALEAFNLGVVDYLLKPFGDERVRECLRRVAARRPAPPAPAAPGRVVARRKRNLVFLNLDEIWAFEAADRLTFVHSRHGKLDLDLSLSAIEVSFGRTLTRVHRNWLVNAAFIKELEREDSETRLFVGESLSAEGKGLHVPVSRERAQALKDTLLENATGVRR
ncbi:MAG: LytTR family DNA-binding domain-containing protein [Myxococcaceae bacterium]